MAKVNATDGFSIKGWMVTDLHLSGGDLIAFAIVENFSQSQAGIYTGGASYLASWMGWTYKTAAGHLQNLVAAGLITEEKRLTSVGIQNAYRVSVKITEGICKNYRRGSVKITEGVRKKLPTDNNIDSKIDINEILGEVSPKQPEQIPPKHFTPPTADEVAAYCKERNNNVDPQRFLAFYESKGWMIGRNKMKDWRAAVRTWELQDKERNNTAPARKSRIITPDNIAEHYGTI